MKIDVVIAPGIRLTNQTAGARYGFPVLAFGGREYGPGDVIPLTTTQAVEFSCGRRGATAGELVARTILDGIGRADATEEERRAADQFLAQLPHA